LSSIESRQSAPRIVATVSDHNQWLAAIRRRIQELGISYEVAGDLAGLHSNYLAKIISDPPPKRASPFTMFLVAQALGLDMQLVENRELIEKLKGRWTKRKLTKIKKPMPADSMHKMEIPIDTLRRRARAGGYARAQYLSRERLSEFGRMAAGARWSKKQCRDRKSQDPASPNHQAPAS
jgi:hypothetical protein